ncbi:MAG: POTRA domain-containing protein [Bacteroidales bacterium]
MLFYLEKVKSLIGRKCFFLVLLLFCQLFYFEFVINAQETENKLVKIDSITIKRNWRTRERIILQELGIKPGDKVSNEQLDASISRIWNIGNFVKVKYTIDTLTGNKYLLNITAQDAVTIMPDLSFNGNRNEYTLSMGVSDNNMLGRNIDLSVSGTLGTYVRNAKINLGIPRQLLYKNMTLGGGFYIGESQNYQYENGHKISGIAYRQNSLNLGIGNPFNDDYHYTFSPDLSLGYYSQKTDSTLLEPGIRMQDNYDVKYLSVSTGESIGLINSIRHQLNGYRVSVGLGFAIGLTNDSPGYFSLGLSAAYHKLFTKIVQVSADFSTGFNTAKLPSQIFYLGPGHVKGINTGERYGNSLYALNTSLNLTYINLDWFAIEQAFFINLGNACDKYFKLYSTEPLWSIGSRVRLMVPMVPWLGITFYYAYRGGNNHWFSVNF